MLGTADDVEVGEAFTASPYLFDNLPDGTYAVTVDLATVPADLIATYDLDGGLDSTTLIVVAGADVTDVDFGYAMANTPPVFSRKSSTTLSMPVSCHAPICLRTMPDTPAVILRTRR